MTWDQVRSNISPGQLQGFYCQLMLSDPPRPLEKLQIQQAASARKIWLPATREQAASLLYRGETPTPRLAERL